MDAEGADKVGQIMWAELDSTFATKGDKINLTRWFGFLHVAKVWLKHYHLRLFILLHMGLAKGILNVQQWGEFVAGKPHKESEGKPTVNRDNDQLKHLRQCTKNNLHLAIAVFLDPSTFFNLHLIVEVTRYVQKWYHMQSITLRSCAEAQIWLVEQVSGDFWVHINATVGVLCDEGVLEKINVISEGAKPAEDSPASHCQNEQARKAAKMVFALAAQRFKRFMFAMVGWPVRSCLMGSPEEEVQKNVENEILEDWRLHEKAMKLKGQFWKKINARSVFHLTPTQQVIKILQDASINRESRNQWSKKTYQAIMASKGSEDGICRLRRKDERAKTRSSRCKLQHYFNHVTCGNQHTNINIL